MRGGGGGEGSALALPLHYLAAFAVDLSHEGRGALRAR